MVSWSAFRKPTLYPFGISFSIPSLLVQSSHLPKRYDAEAEGGARTPEVLLVDIHRLNANGNTLTSCHFIVPVIFCCKHYGVSASVLHMILLVSELIRELSISGPLKSQASVACGQPHVADLHMPPSCPLLFSGVPLIGTIAEGPTRKASEVFFGSS